MRWNYQCGMTHWYCPRHNPIGCSYRRRKNNKLRKPAEHLVTLLSSSGVTGSAWRNLQGMRVVNTERRLPDANEADRFLPPPDKPWQGDGLRVGEIHLFYFWWHITYGDTSPVGTPNLWRHITFGDTLLVGSCHFWGHIACVDTSLVGTHPLWGQATLDTLHKCVNGYIYFSTVFVIL